MSDKSRVSCDISTGRSERECKFPPNPPTLYGPLFIGVIYGPLFMGRFLGAANFVSFLSALRSGSSRKHRVAQIQLGGRKIHKERHEERKGEIKKGIYLSIYIKNRKDAKPTTEKIDIQIFSYLLSYLASIFLASIQLPNQIYKKAKKDWLIPGEIKNLGGPRHAPSGPRKAPD